MGMRTTRRAITVPTTVQVAGGTGTLRGTVHTRIERREVEDAGWSARGAVVSNQLHDSVEQALVAVLSSSSADAGRARAYCGPAHGHTWLLEGGSSWPPRIMLGSRDGPHEYRLVHDLRSHRPARDHLGNTLYMPVLPGRDRDGRSSTA